MSAYKRLKRHRKCLLICAFAFSSLIYLVQKHEKLPSSEKTLTNESYYLDSLTDPTNFNIKLRKNASEVTNTTEIFGNNVSQQRPTISSSYFDNAGLLIEDEHVFKKSVKELMELLKVTFDQNSITGFMMEEALKSEKAFITASLQNYSFPPGRNLSELLMEENGKPIRNIIFTTWRSGSTFLGEAVANHPAMFYHYEPLLHFHIRQVRSGQLAQEGVRVIQNLLSCDYSHLQNYIRYGSSHHNLHSHNENLWKHCRRNVLLCNNSDFLSKMCKLFPFQIVKTVRMRLRLAESLLEDENLDVKVLLLVRDPRGSMQSRRHRSWCANNPDCFDPARLCSDLVDDHTAAITLQQKYPDKIMIIRYEDISMQPISGVKKVLDFFRLSYHRMIEKYIKTHTVVSLGGVSSTFRDSKSTAFKWMDYYRNHTEELEAIENVCKEALTLWGYDLWGEELTLVK